MRGIDYDGLDRSIDGRVSKLRRKLGDDAAAPTRIKTVWGKGYLLVPDAWEARRLKEWLAAGERGLFIRSYVVLAGGLLVVAMLLDLGFDALQARQVRAADPVAGVHAAAHGERARGHASGCTTGAHRANLAERLGLGTRPARTPRIFPAPRRWVIVPQRTGRRCRQGILPVALGRRWTARIRLGPFDAAPRRMRWRASCRCFSTRPSC